MHRAGRALGNWPAPVALAAAVCGGGGGGGGVQGCVPARAGWEGRQHHRQANPHVPCKQRALGLQKGVGEMWREREGRGRIEGAEREARRGRGEGGRRGGGGRTAGGGDLRARPRGGGRGREGAAQSGRAHVCAEKPEREGGSRQRAARRVPRQVPPAIGSGGGGVGGRSSAGVGGAGCWAKARRCVGGAAACTSGCRPGAAHAPRRACPCHPPLASATHPLLVAAAAALLLPAARPGRWPARCQRTEGLLLREGLLLPCTPAGSPRGGWPRLQGCPQRGGGLLQLPINPVEQRGQWPA